MAEFEDPNWLRRRAVPWHHQVQMNPPASLLERIAKEEGSTTSDGSSHEEGSSGGVFNTMRTVAMPNELLRRPMTKKEEEFVKLLRQLRDFSPNYEGDTTNARNKSADIPENQNTSIWMTGLPPSCTAMMLLGAMAQVGGLGKVWSTVINPASPQEGKPFAAAKVVFFAREGAEKLMAAIQDGRLRIGGRRPRATYNRIKSAPQKSDTTRSRVVVMEGPAALVNESKMGEWFATKFKFQTEAVLLVDHNLRKNTNTIEWRFGSYRSQAEAAVIAIRKELDGIVRWKHG